ncbi:hypothetical protein JCM3765_005483 [Sporobolomyces pararoseus]
MYPHRSQQQHSPQWSNSADPNRPYSSNSTNPQLPPPQQVGRPATSTDEFFPQLPEFPTFVPPRPPPTSSSTQSREPFPSLPPSASFSRHRQYSQQQQQHQLPSLPLAFEGYPATSIPPPPLSAPLPLPLDPQSLPNPDHSLADTHSDLYTLRSLQRQRKREFSNSTSSSISSSRNYSQDGPSSSTLLGFAGEAQTASSYKAGGGGTSTEFGQTRNSSGHSTPHSGSMSSSFGEFNHQTSQGYWSRPFASAAPSVASSIASAEPSPPILYGESSGIAAAGNYYDYFQPLVQAASVASSSPNEGLFSSSQYDPSAQLNSGSNTLPTPPLIHQHRSRSASTHPLFVPPRDHAAQYPTHPTFPLPSSSSSIPSSSRDTLIPPALNPHNLPFAPPTIARAGTSTEEPPSDPDSTNSQTSLTNAKLLPILERGLRIRIKHYEELPNPLGVTHPARNRLKKPQVSPGPEGGLAGLNGDEEEWEGNWRIVKNASGKKIIGLEIKVNCENCIAMNESDSQEKETKKVARVVLRNLSTKLLGMLSEIDQRLQEEEIQILGVASTLAGGGRRSSRSRSTTDGSNPSFSSSPSGSSAFSSSTATPGTSTTPTPPNLLAPGSSIGQGSTLSRWTVPEELGIGLTGSNCLVCAGLAPPKPDIEPDPRLSRSQDPQQPRERGYEDTLSAAIDRFEKLNLNSIKKVKQEEEEVGEYSNSAEHHRKEADKEGEKRKDWKKLVHLEAEQLPEEHLIKSLNCDVCNLICGLSTIEYTDTTTPAASATIVDNGASTAMKKSNSTTARAFTVEVICARCDALFKACSDCGGGGGRLTPGKWRCKELFPDGRKNCQLSHARNPTLNEIDIVVSPVSSLSPTELDQASAACRKLFFNTRLGTLCRPEFMLRGDGLANSFKQAENLSIDYWGRLEDVLRGETPPDLSFKRYLTITYSRPRPRHPPKSQQASTSKTTSVKAEDFDDEYDLGEPQPAPPKSKPAKSDAKGIVEAKTVPWAFSIVEVDFSAGTLFFCCVIPWATSGQSFDANSLLIERTNERVKSDLIAINDARRAQGLPVYPRLKYNFIVSPFRLDSKNSQNLNRRGFYTLDQLEEIDDEGVNRRLFPPYRQIWLPAHYAKAMHTFVRKLENEEDMGGPPPQNAPRKRKKKTAAAL